MTALAEAPSQLDDGRALSASRMETLFSSRVAVSLLAGHALLGIALHRSALLAGLHGLAVCCAGVAFAVRAQTTRVASVLAYIAMTEVLWRMSAAPLPYEFGKYATVLICGIALLSGPAARVRWTPIVYFAALLPSALLVAAAGELALRPMVQTLSFNLSGPLCLATATWLLSEVRMGAAERRTMLLAFLCAGVAVASAVLYGTVTATDLTFTTESNHATSGGFGPNQVSATLGLGALIAFLASIDETSRTHERLIFGLLIVGIGAEAALTFSRGGLYTAAAAAVASLLVIARRPKYRGRILLIGLLAIGLSAAVVIPRVNAFTGGKLGARFADSGTSNRGTLVLDDLGLWLANPILGVGPGRSGSFRSLVSGGAGHTEPSRMLAEHGTFGLISLLTLLMMAAGAMLSRRGRPDYGLRLAFLCWATVSMLHAAMRIAAIGILFGLAFASFDEVSNRARAQRDDDTGDSGGRDA